MTITSLLILTIEAVLYKSELTFKPFNIFYLVFGLYPFIGFELCHTTLNLPLKCSNRA